VLLEAQDLAAHGLVDETGYQRAVELDPNNREAREALARVQATSGTSSGLTKYVLGAIFAVAAAACAAVALFWRRAPT
jgi:hypothetical protein